MSVYESLCLQSPISAAGARPRCTRSRTDRVWSLQIRSDHRPYTLGPGGYPFPEVNLPEFLTSRRQITTVEGCTSAPAEIGAGVPQGAILSPLLFSVYLNDISSATQASNINLFADDTSAYVSSQATSVLNSDLQTTADSLSSWFSRWHVAVHPAKTVCMVLHSTGMPPCQLNIKINGNHIAQVTRHRHLGVTFNERLSWKDHVHDVIKSLPRKLDSSVALAGNSLQPLSVISMHSASGLVSNMAALSGVVSVPQMLHA